MHRKGHAVAVLIESPQGIPLVRDPKKSRPLYWKLSGGRGGAKETAGEVALREIREELGLSLRSEDLQLLHEEDRGSHVFTLFKATLPDLAGIKEEGNEGEEIKLFFPDQIRRMDDFFPPHRGILRRLGLIG